MFSSTLFQFLEVGVKNMDLKVVQAFFLAIVRTHDFYYLYIPDTGKMKCSKTAFEIYGFPSESESSLYFLYSSFLSAEEGYDPSCAWLVEDGADETGGGPVDPPCIKVGYSISIRLLIHGGSPPSDQLRFLVFARSETRRFPETLKPPWW